MNIVEFDEIRAALGEIKSSCNFVIDVTTKEGYKASKDAHLAVGKVITKLEAARKAKKAYFIDGGKEVDKQAKIVAAELESYRADHSSAYKGIDKAKKEREENRLAMLDERLLFIVNIAESMAESHSSEVQAAMQQMNDEKCENFQEFTETALKARNKARAALADLYTSTLKREADQIELDKLRADNEKRAQEDRDAELIEQATIDVNNKIKADNDKIEADKQARLADTAHKANVNNAALNALVDHAGLSSEQAKSVVIALASGKIPSCGVYY